MNGIYSLFSNMWYRIKDIRYVIEFCRKPLFGEEHNSFKTRSANMSYYILITVLFCPFFFSLSNSQGLGWYGTMTGCGSSSYTVSPHLNGPLTDTAPLLFTCSNLDMNSHHSLYVTPQNWWHYQVVILQSFFMNVYIQCV